jgi:integrase
MPKITLNQGFVDQQASCPAHKSREDYYDTKLVGLLVKVLASGRKTFYIRYRDSRGKQVERKVGNASVMKVADARRLAADLLTQVAMGADPFEKRKALKNVPTFGDFVATSYMSHIKSYKRSWITDESLLRNHILPMIGHLHLDEIKRQHLVDLFSLHRQHHKPSSTNRVIILCRYILNCALKWEVEGLERNPTKGIPLFPENNRRERYLTEEEAKRLFAAMENTQNPLLPYIVTTLLLTGARRREVLTARWEDFDLEKRLWRIEFNKAGQTRHVPLSDAMLRLLAVIPRKEGAAYLFPNPKTGKPFINVFNSWNTARKQAGLPDVRVHDLRHSFASFVINAGHSLYEVQKLLGHTQVKTTQRYAHLTQESLINAADTAANALPLNKLLPPDKS